MVEAITARLAEYALSVGPNDLPEAVRREALRSFFNIVGCTLGGGRHHAVDLMDQALTPFAGAPQATLFGRGRKSDVLHATLINCLASAINSFDDTHEQAVVHPSGPVSSGLLALAELRPVRGADLLAAFAVGVEMACRLLKSVTVPPAQGSMSWSGTGISGGFAAAVAAGKLLGLDQVRMQRAMGIALAQASGIRAMHGTMTMPAMPAHAAQTGTRAALIAERGYTAGMQGLEGNHGYLSIFASHADTDALVGDLGTRFELLRNTYKPYPCGIVIHPIIDACYALRGQPGVSADGIARVDIQVSPGGMTLCNRPNPRDELEAHVSLHHWVAVTFIRGTTRIADMDTETAVRDPALMAFQSRVTAHLDPSVAADAAVVTLTLTDGSTRTACIDHCIGSAARPMSDSDLERKFEGQAEPVVGAARTRELIARAWGIADSADAGDLARAAA